MLEGLAAWVLNNYLGRYVENLNTDQLSIGLLNGEVELECLPLKKDAFNFLDVPLQIVAGYIGKIRLKIPVTRLRSEPWVISIEQLYIVVGPTLICEYDEEREQEREHTRKLAKLDFMEAGWRSDHEAKQETSYYASSYSSWVSYGTSFVSNIVENLQLKVRDVHIRFEDAVTIPGKPVACGITIESLLAQSANDMWIPQFVQKGEGDATKKLVELQNLSVYWDVTGVDLIGDLPMQELVDAMQALLSSKLDSEKSRHNYVVEPVCATARIERNCDCNPLKTRSKPRITCALFVDRFVLDLTEIQYGSIVNWCYEFNRFATAQPFLKWRPKDPVNQHVKEWWQFAARPTLERVRMRKISSNWKYVLARAKNNVLYVKAYTEHLINPVTCPADLREHKGWMEQEIDFKELKILRELAMERVAAIEEAQRNKDSDIKNRSGAGLLQRWFPLWTGWYLGSKTEPEESQKQPENAGHVLEEELLDVLNDSVEETDSLFCRDLVFARIDFTLKSGVFTLSSGSISQPLLNLEFSTVSFGVELRPRNRSTLFDLSLGALYLRDAMTAGSLFPSIATPQVLKEVVKIPSSTSIAMSIKKVLPWVTSAGIDAATCSAVESDEPLFHLIYEVRPLRSNADYKLHVRSRSLDVVYNASVFHRIREFFGAPHRLAAPASSSSAQRSRLGEELAAVANKVKQQTKEELLKNWDQMLKGKRSKGKRWDIELDISTPQIILPESFFDENTTIVILSFGRLQFSTETYRAQQNQRVETTSPTQSSYYDEEDEEVFRTPFSTPPGEEEALAKSPLPTSPPTSASPVDDLTESCLESRMYERYSLHLRDLQILVTKAKSNWKYAYLLGTSTSHVVNRFSISLHLERRIVQTIDPKWPRAKVFGDLPSLVIHVDEQKIEALKACWAVVTSPSPRPMSKHPPTNSPTFFSNLDEEFEDLNSIPNDVLLLAMEFQIGQMSVDVQSSGRSLAELQVNTIKSMINKRPMDTTVCFTIQGLLLVDALQTFGPDFELLIASHKNISLDSVSGSMRDSEPTSPVSPASPNLHNYSGININAAIKQLEKSQMKKCGATSPLLWPMTPVHSSDAEALIIIDYTVVKTQTETTRLISVQFNNLDIIANQETIKELINFFNRYIPKVASVKQPSWEVVTSHIKLSFEFHRLGILLIKLVPSANVPSAVSARKVATVALTNAAIQSSLDDVMEIRGSLGGIQMVDLTCDRVKYSKIFSVGRNPLERNQSLVEQLQADLYSTSTSSSTDPEAFYFTLLEKDNVCNLQIRMASVRCTHSTLFWTDLASCVSELGRYAAAVGSSLRSAATEVAMGMVGARSGDSHPPSPTKVSSPSLFSLTTFRLQLVIDSPIITVPESPHSDDVVEAHLGRITVTNFHLDEEEVFDRVAVVIRDVSLYSKHFESDHLNKSFAIVHSTALELNVDLHCERCQLDLNGKIVTPVKVSLSKRQYHQILRTISLLSSDFHVSSDFPYKPSPTSSSSYDGSWCVKAGFQMPNLSVELINDLSDDNRGLVILTLNRFEVNYTHRSEEATTISITLDSVNMEDLLAPVDSKHRSIMVSSSVGSDKRTLRARKYLSSSCPDMTSPHCLLTSPISLPDKLDTENVFRNMRRMKEKMMYGGNIHLRSLLSIHDCPCTPPPSPLPTSPIHSLNADALVSVTLRFVDDSHLPPQRLLDVTFNCLDMVVKYQPWNVVVDFFNCSSDRTASRKSSRTMAHSDIPPDAVSDDRSKTTVHVRRLSVLFCKDDYDLASVCIANFRTDVVRHAEGDVQIEGTLGRVSLVDLTPRESYYYRDRFTNFGDEVLEFHVFKYGNKDPTLKRDFDVDFRLSMSAVHYVHTNRFYVEMISFLQNLLHCEASNVKPTTKMNPDKFRSLRCRLNVEIESPAIVLPVALWSRDVLVARLGKINIDNRFVLHNSSDGVCLLDVTHIKLSDVELCVGNQTDGEQMRPKGGPLLTEKFYLDLEMKRNLDCELVKSIPDINIEGGVSAVRGSVNLEQYKIIRGILEHNIGEQVDVDRKGLHFQRKKLDSLGEGRMQLSLKLVDVTMDFVDAGQLAKVYFINSELTYRSTSFGSSEVDLVSREILISDTRFSKYPANSRPNVFCNILQATRNSSSAAANSKSSEDKGPFLQAELHYRATKDFRRLTVLLNHMRVIVIMDWWTEVLKYISASVQMPDNLVKCAAMCPTVCAPSGVVTRQVSMISTDLNFQPPFELKINITETGIVIVEDPAVWDTNSIILETTAIVNHCPQSADKPLSCTVHRLEVFSCILGLEEDTALSIVDPIINADVVLRKQRRGLMGGGGLTELTDSVASDRIVEVSASELSIRVSYHDLRSFMRIVDSFPQQLKSVFSVATAITDDDICAQNVATAEELLLASKISKLEAMGFGHGDCYRALADCNFDVGQSALWLTQNAIVAHSIQSEAAATDVDYHTQLKVHLDSLSVCLIDDCKDADVPLLEFHLRDFLFERKPLNVEDYCSVKEGVSANARGRLHCDYYNRNLSGWEPFVEPFSFKVDWKKETSNVDNQFSTAVSVAVDDLIDLNFTSTLLELYRTVKTNWTEDYYKQSVRVGDGDAINYRRRSPFVPFALKNSTGCRLCFSTLTISPDQLLQLDYDSVNTPPSAKSSDCWSEVEVDQIVPFTFEGRRRMRHRDTRETLIHQLMVRVDGWQQLAPVSVDKVGVFFRDSKPAVIGKLTDTARIVFEVNLEGSARKLITVRSALVVYNRTEATVEVRLDSSKTLTPISSLVLHLKPNDKFPVPLQHVNSLIYCRPYDRVSPFLYCCSPVRWQHITKPNETQEDIYVCNSMSSQVHRLQISSREHYFRFTASVHRENYPLDNPSYPVNIVRPAHMITLLPPVTLSNLLPFDLTYRLHDFEGVIPPSKSSSIHHLSVLDSFTIDLEFETSSFEMFKLAHEFDVVNGNSGFLTVLEMKDNQNRSLMIQAKGVAQHGGSSLEIRFIAEYWMVNRTGLPLIFKQESVATESAGQSSDNEKARSLAPLLFSFADREAPSLCSVRIGRMVHPTGEPRWCRHFNLQKGVQFRRLYVLSRTARPDWVYSIGIDVRVGPPKSGNVYIVTLTPRFQLDNHSTHRLEFIQKYSLTSGQPMADYRLSALPQSFLPFHWPRLDQEQLLCVRMSDVGGCTWSGGFHIERIDSFHINMRDEHGKPVFLRVEVVLLGATYTVVFTDADNLPPPYLLQNFCEVPIICYQTQVAEERLRITVRPNTSVKYALDEPTRDPTLTCIAPGGSHAFYNLNQFGDCKQQLSYENFIYIAFTETFSISNDLRTARYGEVGQSELVLTVPTGTTQVILQPKEKGDRSQLWRMTSEGMIQHEGSSPPRNTRKPGTSSSSFNSAQVLVLDIAEKAIQPDRYTRLMLRKPNPQRRSTQTWEFTEDGRLRCRHSNIYVQCAEGYHGLRAGNDVVIGPLQPVVYATTGKGIPVEQAINRHRLYPGSGLICLRVVPDGPTRVLQILDITKNSKAGSLTVGVTGDRATEESAKAGSTNWQVTVWLPVGLGISIVNRLSEELLYTRFLNIMLEYSRTKAEQCLNGSVQEFQVDNQLYDADCSVVLYVTPSTGNEEQQRNFLPAISFVGSWTNKDRRHLNVEIFKSFQLQVKNSTLIIEERLLYKFLQFLGYCADERWNNLEDGSHMEIQGFYKAAAVALAKRYYFGNVKLMLEQVRLGVITSSNLSADLRTVKTNTGLTLVGFEDALVELDPFVRSHSCETARFLLDSIWEHYKEGLIGQAAKILGAVDFLGNPIGLVNDFSEGLSEFLNEGNVGGFLKNVTHGISNSAAKMTGSLSDGLSLVAMDEQHLESRRRIQSAHGGSSSQHMVAGIKGLGFGLYSGFTSIATKTYEGAASEGIQGFITGLAKGLVGTFTKPAAGVLDLASSAASVVRETSKSKHRKAPDKCRSRRLCVGPGGLLPRYSPEHSRGLDILYQLNDKDYSEILIAIEGLNYSNDGLFALISSTTIYFVSLDARNSSRECVLKIPLKDLFHCKSVQELQPNKVVYYLELTTKGSSANTETVYRPRVLCDTETIALKVSQQVNYAKSLYEEMVHTLTTAE